MGAWRRALDDGGSASLVSYIVAAAVFLLGSSFLINFVVEPPGDSTANLEHVNLRSQAETALEVLLGTPGYPPTWEETTGSEDLLRLGLIQSGTSLRIDPDKFDALARGRLATASTTNGVVDYAEAKTALGLDGYEFHLRAYPLLGEGTDATYGTAGMDDFHVAYVGDYTSGVAQAAATAEMAALDALDIDFTPSLRSSLAAGDVYTDASGDLRTNLLPNIGASIQQTVISGSGSGARFYRVPASSYSTYVPLADSQAMALSPDGTTLTYTKNRELRAVVGKASLGDATSAVLSWDEWVDSDRGTLSYDCGDFGYVEVSRDNGATWVALTSATGDRSRDCTDAASGTLPYGNAFRSRTAAISCATACGDVLLGFRWVGDNDNTIGYGWVVDDVRVLVGLDVYMHKTFESPEYDMVILGSNIDHNALTPNDVKEAMRDYVDRYGGRLVVLGGQTNVNWLDRLFDVGVSGGSGGVSVPDVTHPMLTLPNPLSYAEYPRAGTYTVSEEDAGLLNMIAGTSETEHVLSIAREGAFGSGSSVDGSVILTSYLPASFATAAERSRFFANGIVYGKFHYLYLEVGPTIPAGQSVASVTRSATMNMYRDGNVNYTEMAFVLYVWPGLSAAQTAAAASVEPTPPQSLVATATPGQVSLAWTAPLSPGSSAITGYNIHLMNSATPGVPVATVGPTTLGYAHTGLTNGNTYEYTVRAVNAAGVGGPSGAASATPVAAAAKPASITAAGGASQINISWTDVWSSSMGNLYGYNVYVNNSDNTSHVLLAETGNQTWYVLAVSDTHARTFRVAAVNALGEGPKSDASQPASATFALPAPALAVSSTPAADDLVLTWTAPAETYGQTILGYRIVRATSEAGAYSELVPLTGALNLTFTDANLGPSVTRWYKVQAVTAAGEGVLSAADDGTTPPVIGAPTLVVTQGSGPHNLTLSWAAPLDLLGQTITNYSIYRADSAGGAYAVLATIGTNTSYTDVGLGASVTKWYKVAAITAVGEGTASAEMSATTMAVPGTPVVTATNLLGTATITWTQPLSDSPILHYEIQRGATADTATEPVGTDTDTSYSHAYDASKPFYRVRAVSAAGAGAWSAADSAAL